MIESRTPATAVTVPGRGQPAEEADVPKRTCTIEGCDRPAGVPGSARGWCRAHYRRWQNHGDPHEPSRRTYTWRGEVCSVDGCDRAVYSLGLCEAHHGRKRRLGSTDLPTRQVKRCSASSCKRPFYGTELCRWHYDRKRPGRWGEPDPERARHNAKRRRARLAGAQSHHTNEEWLAKLDEFGGRCAYCGDQAEGKDHVVPLRRDGGDGIDNVVPACKGCNSSKHTQTLPEWYRFIEPERAAPRMRGVGLEWPS